MRCLLRFGYYEEWFSYLCLPLFALLFPLIFVFAPAELYDRLLQGGSSRYTARFYVPTVVFTLTLIFQTTAQSLFTIFRCYHVGGGLIIHPF